MNICANSKVPSIILNDSAGKKPLLLSSFQIAHVLMK